jgi:DNA-binding PadR family transcriptional regulator
MRPDYPLLGLLARKPSSGYEIGKWLAADGRFAGRGPSMAPIYRSLTDLRERGWVSVRSVASAKGPDAKVYSLTAEGRAALKDWAESEYVPAERFLAPDFMVRLSFAGQFGPEHLLRLVRTELEFRRAQRAEEDALAYESLSDELIPELDPRWVRVVDTLARNRGWEAGSQLIAWLETLERTLVRWEAAGEDSLPPLGMPPPGA